MLIAGDDMVEFEVLKKIRDITLWLTIIFAGIIILIFFLFGNTSGDMNILSIVGLCVLLALVSFIIHSIINSSYGEDRKYFSKDFGLFTTEINKSFDENWIESSEDGELSNLNCNIKKFTNISRFTGAGELVSSRTVGNLKETTYRGIACNDFFEITYLTFDSKEECISNGDKIKEIFKKREDLQNLDRTAHFSSENIHIVFYAYSQDNGGNPYRKDGHGKDVRRAAKALKLR